jgi:hypothetical protein
MYGKGIDVAAPQHQHTLYAAAGARAGVEIRVSGALSIDLHLDVLGTLTPTALRLGQMDVWTTSPVSAVVGVGLAGDFR